MNSGTWRQTKPGDKQIVAIGKREGKQAFGIKTVNGNVICISVKTSAGLASLSPSNKHNRN